MNSMNPTSSTLAQAHPDHPKLSELGLKDGELAARVWIPMGFVTSNLPLNFHLFNYEHTNMAKKRLNGFLLRSLANTAAMGPGGM